MSLPLIIVCLSLNTQWGGVKDAHILSFSLCNNLKTLWIIRGGKVKFLLFSVFNTNLSCIRFQVKGSQHVPAHSVETVVSACVHGASAWVMTPNKKVIRRLEHHAETNDWSWFGPSGRFSSGKNNESLTPVFKVDYKSGAPDRVVVSVSLPVLLSPHERDKHVFCQGFARRGVLCTVTK